MGTHTVFAGEFVLDRPLLPTHHAYLAQFNTARRMKRPAAVLEILPDPVLAVATDLPLGPEGAYYVPTRRGATAALNHADGTQPGLWCGWKPNAAGTALVWDGSEKFYNYVAWIEYLIVHFLAPWGYVLNGTVRWESEDPHTPAGEIVVQDNVVQAYNTNIRWL